MGTIHICLIYKVVLKEQHSISIYNNNSYYQVDTFNSHGGLGISVSWPVRYIK